LINKNKNGVTMRNKLEPFKRFIFIGIIVITLGVTFSTTLKGSVDSLGIVFIAVGVLFFIIGMSTKRKEDEPKYK
jgi:predicted membrane channel-forming protein YqfA (hemolysin III family)